VADFASACIYLC